MNLVESPVMETPLPCRGGSRRKSTSGSDTAKPILREAPTLKTLSAALTASIEKPTRNTLRILERALDWLRPFESSEARVTSKDEKYELLTLLDTHRLILSPYIDVDRIEVNLRSLR